MAKVIYVTRAQVHAAEILIRLREEKGEPVEESLRKIAAARHRDYHVIREEEDGQPSVSQDPEVADR